MTVARQVAHVSVADLGLRSLWAELGIRDIEGEDPSQPEGYEAPRSVYDLRRLLDIESPVIRASGP